MIFQKKLQNFLFSPQKSGEKIFTDVPKEASAALAARLFCGNSGKPVAVATPDSTWAEQLESEVRELLKLAGVPEKNILLLPEAGRGKMIFSGSESRRARVLNAALQSDFDMIIGSINALFGPAPLPDVTKDSILTLKPGMEISPDELLSKLVAIDYDDEYESTVPGEFARRGGIVDVFSPEYDYPCRIEYFGDEIESLRSFDPVTQRSTGKLEEYRIIGRGGVTAGGAADGDIFDYFNDNTVELAIFHPEDCSSRLLKYSGNDTIARYDEITELYHSKGILNLFCSISAEPDVEVNTSPVSQLSVSPGYDENIKEHFANPVSEKLVRDSISNILHNGNLLCTAKHEEDIPEIRKWCEENFSNHRNIDFAASELQNGFLIDALHFGVATAKELTKAGFKHSADRDPAKGILEDAPETFDTGDAAQKKDEELHMADLESGDLAVHIDHGIGIFRGFKTLNTNGLAREVIVLEYRDGQLLYVPLLAAHKISRYLGSPDKVPLHRLGSVRWEKDKENARRGVRSYAADMLRMQAVRQTVSGLQMSDKVPNWKSFLRNFAFEDTPDQSRATLEIIRDMTGSKPMDRLLCGDVGYGKTEVAMRAAFIAVANGYQVAVMAPTTVLAEQHYRSFLERFAGYPVTIQVLNRYRSAADQTKILEHLESGGIDIVIGTHRLCGKNVKFKNLGLVIIDEEQRFGVNHKERLRRFRTEVGVLAMSATPIPRTLYLAMAGARDLSTLTTAPKLRTPVRTIVAPEDMKLAVGAINTELARGGQVYYLHNRVNTIARRAERLRELLPNCKISVAHARMPAEQLEEVMRDFVSGKTDCLVSTTIIESGLDVPNANTMIIERADRFGLAELYQLRGRVGRAARQAYSYMFLPKDQIITGDARKRLSALKRCTSQGAGFQLALRDLEIRGSGNLLGAEQSGHLNLIGFDLYCHLLRQEVARLSGKELKFAHEVNIGIDFVVFARAENAKGMLCALFPSTYISGERLRVEAYRRLAHIETLDELDDYRSELTDRFGKMPEESNNLFEVTRLRILGQMANLRSINVVDGVVVLQTLDGEVYREHNGKRPFLDLRDAPALRMAHLKNILYKAIKRYNNAATA